MSLRPDGSYRCDRCDTDLENGGVHESAVVSTILDGNLITLHFCTKPRKGAPDGCSRHVISPSSLKAYRKANT